MVSDKTFLGLSLESGNMVVIVAVVVAVQLVKLLSELVVFVLVASSSSLPAGVWYMWLVRSLVT